MKFCAILLSLALMLAGAASAEAFEPIHVSLWGNPSTGYEWTCEYDDNGVLEAPMLEFVEDAHEADATGYGGSYEYYFGVAGAGEAQILFNYGVSWGVAAPERSAICSVRVAGDGARELRWAECYSGDDMIVVTLPSDPTSGWNWNYEADELGVAELVSEQYSATDDALEGAGGKTRYQIKILKPGSTVLLFNYTDMWNPYAAAAETYAVSVNVSEDMEISISVDEA